MKKFKKKFWIVKEWLEDGTIEQYLYGARKEAEFIKLMGDHIVRIEVKEL